jgi:hypothetical protein
VDYQRAKEIVDRANRWNRAAIQAAKQGDHFRSLYLSKCLNLEIREYNLKLAYHWTCGRSFSRISFPGFYP